MTYLSRILVFLTALVCTSALTVQAEEWVSPIDKKYSAQNPILFAKVARAREIIDLWRGRSEDLPDAYELLSSALRSEPSFAPAFPEVARFLMIAGGRTLPFTAAAQRITSPEDALIRVLKIEPDYADAYVLLGYVYTISRRYEEASQALRKAESIGTSIPWLSINKAALLVRDEKYQEALDLYQAVIDSGTRNRKARSAAFDQIADVLRQMKQFPRAHTAYRRAIAYDPESAWEKGNYAEFLLYDWKDVDGAIDQARQALKQMDYGAARFTLAAALYTKWAMLLRDGKSEVDVQSYYDEAASVYPYQDQIIERTAKHEFTRITSQTLKKHRANASATSSRKP